MLRQILPRLVKVFGYAFPINTTNASQRGIQQEEIARHLTSTSKMSYEVSMTASTYHSGLFTSERT